MATFDSLETNPSAAAMSGLAVRTLNSGELLSGRYRISHVLGAGGMGVIHNAIDTRTGTSVAVKVIHASSAHDPHARARFSREVASLSLVGSEHVAQALDADVLEDGTPYLVMELLDGRDLRREAKLRGPLPVREAVTYVVQACRGVSKIHGSGIVHRDLKPHNLFITNLDGARKIKILDFGIAKSLEADCSLTTTNVAVGTPLYMAPELLRNPRELSPLTDVWSLGVILYEIIAGFSPFAGAPAPSVILAVLDDMPVPLARLRPDVPQELDDAIQRALAKNPAERWQSAELFARSLLPFAQPEPLIVSEEQRAVRAPEDAAPIDVGQLRRRFRAELERAHQLPTMRPPGAHAGADPAPWALSGSVPLPLGPPPIWDDRSSSAHSSFVVPAFRASSRPGARATVAVVAALVVAVAALLGLGRRAAAPPVSSDQPTVASAQVHAPPATPAGEGTLTPPSIPGPGTTTHASPAAPSPRQTLRAPGSAPSQPATATAAPTSRQNSKAARLRGSIAQTARPRPVVAETLPRQKTNDDNPLHL